MCGAAVITTELPKCLPKWQLLVHGSVNSSWTLLRATETLPNPYSHPPSLPHTNILDCLCGSCSVTMVRHLPLIAQRYCFIYFISFFSFFLPFFLYDCFWFVWCLFASLWPLHLFINNVCYWFIDLFFFLFIYYSFVLRIIFRLSV